MPIYRPSELCALIHQLGCFPNKNLSQNFLIDGNILEKILQVSKIQAGDLVLEIGSGPGALTEALLARGAEVVAVEQDKQFAKALERLSGNLTIYPEDILSFPLEKVFQNRPAKVVANIPYQITTPILQRLLPMHGYFSSLTLMVQREFGKRLCAKKNTPAYSSLTLFAQYYADVHFSFSVKPSSFYPSPTVDSCVVHLDLRKREFSTPSEHFFQVMRPAFQQRRKMLRSSLKKQFPAPQIESALSEIGLSLASRPEQLSFEEFQQLAQQLYKNL